MLPRSQMETNGFFRSMLNNSLLVDCEVTHITIENQVKIIFKQFMRILYCNHLTSLALFENRNLLMVDSILLFIMIYVILLILTLK